MTAEFAARSPLVVSESDVARNVVALVRLAESGEEIVVTRDGRPVATLGPHVRPNGAAFITLFESYGTDPGWATLIEDGRLAMWPDSR